MQLAETVSLDMADILKIFGLENRVRGTDAKHLASVGGSHAVRAHISKIIYLFFTVLVLASAVHVLASAVLVLASAVLMLALAVHLLKLGRIFYIVEPDGHRRHACRPKTSLFYSKKMCKELNSCCYEY